MPTRLVLCAINALDFATGTANPILVANQPMDHLKLSARGRVARTTSDAAQDYFFTWGGQGYYMNFFSWYRHNLEPGATWQVIGYPNADWTGTPVFDTGSVAPYSAYLLGDYGAMFGVLPLGYTNAVFLDQARFSTIYFTRGLVLSIKVHVSNVGNSAGLLDVSRAYGGDYTEMVTNYSTINKTWKDDSKAVRSGLGGPRVDASYKYRQMQIELPWVDSTQRAVIEDMQRYAGTTRDFFVSAYPQDADVTKERDYSMIAKLDSTDDIQLPVNNPYSAAYATRFKFSEI